MPREITSERGRRRVIRQLGRDFQISPKTIQRLLKDRVQLPKAKDIIAAIVISYRPKIRLDAND